MTKIILKPGREKSLLRRHPWIFSGAIEKIEGDVQSGDTVDVFSANGQFLGRGAYSPHSQIRVRLWTFDESEEIDKSFFIKRILQSRENRAALFGKRNVTGYRLVYGESDGLPGVIIDRYNEYFVCQFLSVGAERIKETIVETLRENFNCAGIYERSDAEMRQKEGLKLVKGVLWGEEPREFVEIQEDEVRFFADVKNGHKTGFYFDQRDNRRLLYYYSAGKEVLNCFSYSGGFGVWALHGGAAQIVNVDSSPAALNLARRNIELNGLDLSKAEFIQADAFKLLREFEKQGRLFDVIVLDPPKFAASAAQVQRAARGYKDINRMAFKIIRPGGLLFTFSCSGMVEPALFQKIVADAALDAAKESQIMHWLTQSGDHPVALNFPEAAYLKGLVCRVSGL